MDLQTIGQFISQHGLPICLVVYFVFEGRTREKRQAGEARENIKAVQTIAVSAVKAMTECTAALKRLEDKIDQHAKG